MCMRKYAAALLCALILSGCAAAQYTPEETPSAAIETAVPTAEPSPAPVLEEYSKIPSLPSEAPAPESTPAAVPAGNLALDENIAPSDFTIEEIEPCGYVWENTPIKLHAHCYKAPYIMPPYPNRTLEPCGEYQVVTHKLPLTLEPFGCTNLRLTYFPKVALIDKNKQRP